MLLRDKGYRLLAVLVCICIAHSLSGQVKMGGTVYSTADKSVVADANVILQNKNGQSILSYTLTNEHGRFILNYTGKADSLRITVTGMNIKTFHIIIPAKPFDNLVIKVAYSSLKLKEIIVKAPPVQRRGDTIAYYVSSYMDSIDRSIGDVLKKMPGIIVDKDNGKINFNGKEIKYFYIEGLDMLGDNYGVATKNVRARDVAKVEVMESYQPVKSLQKKVLSNETALNLKLKNSAKGTFARTFKIGVGYKPLMWVGEATAMYFGKKFQTMDVYKTNNTGDDITGEVLGGYIGEMSELTGMTVPSSPPLSGSRYLKNNIHAVRFDAMSKINDSLNFSANISYLHDISNSSSASWTTYYFKDAEPLVVAERLAAHTVTNTTSASIFLESNTKSRFYSDRLVYYSKWKSNMGTVNDMQQKYSLSPNVCLSNKFSYIKPVGNIIYDAGLDVAVYSLQSDLTVSPCIYPQIFNYPDSTTIDARQSLSTDNITAGGKAKFSSAVGNWHFGGNISANFLSERMKSHLNALYDNVLVTSADTLNNDIYWRKFSAGAGPYVRYDINQIFSFSVVVPVDYKYIYWGENTNDSNSHLNKFSLSPSANLIYKVTRDLKLNANASYYDNYGDLYDVYGGYVMSSYRNFSANDGLLPKNKYRSCGFDLSYGNPLMALFGGLDASYWYNRTNVMYGTDFYGYLTKSRSLAMDNSSHGYNAKFNLGKRFDGIETTISFSARYNKSFGNTLLNNEMLKINYASAGYTLEFQSAIGDNVRFDYSIAYSTMKSRIEKSSNGIEPIRVLQQAAKLNITFAKKGVVKLSGTHYFNNSVKSGDKNMFFADASVSFKTKKAEYILEGRNLLYTKTYNSNSYSEITSYSYLYDLRPLSVIFTVSFFL